MYLSRKFAEIILERFNVDGLKMKMWQRKKSEKQNRNNYSAKLLKKTEKSRFLFTLIQLNPCLVLTFSFHNQCLWVRQTIYIIYIVKQQNDITFYIGIHYCLHHLVYNQYKHNMQLIFAYLHIYFIHIFEQIFVHSFHKPLYDTLRWYKTLS